MVTIKELSQQIQKLFPRYYKNECRDIASGLKMIVQYAIEVKDIGATMKTYPDKLIFEYSNGRGQFGMDDLSYKLIWPHLYDIYYKKQG